MKLAESIESERPTLLIVELDVLVRQPIAEYLRECGYRVLECGNTEDALLVVNSEAMTIEAVLANARADGKLDGFGFARWIRENRPGLEVILTGTVANATKEAGELCEEGPHLQKPYDPRRLLDRIKRRLAERQRRDKR